MIGSILISLHDRSQPTQIGSEVSAKLTTACNVTEGSVQGPLLKKPLLKKACKSGGHGHPRTPWLRPCAKNLTFEC